MSTIISQVDPQMEESPVQRRGSKAYQIFPEANMNEDSDSSSYPEDFRYRRERLPSIVVEPTEQSELEKDGEQLEDIKMEEGSVARKPSIGPSQSQLSLSRLTPPTSSTTPEAAPPCLRS
ncbi:protein LBH-like [Scomber scombrus]|uniref:Protein LBH-like n=1 Tax=Scomber scombrus TaxID=13677 RepID=A0AAV1PYJ2_SCOSC